MAAPRTPPSSGDRSPSRIATTSRTCPVVTELPLPTAALPPTANPVRPAAVFLPSGWGCRCSGSSLVAWCFRGRWSKERFGGLDRRSYFAERVLW